MARPVIAPNEVAHVELQALCNSLGYLEKDDDDPCVSHWKYRREPDCHETVRELIRSLRHDDDACDVRRELGRLQIVQKDLIPIIKTCDGDKDTALFDVVVRLLINLTQPARICFKNEIPQDRTTRNHYLEVEADLQTYKEAVAGSGFFGAVAEKLKNLLALDWDHRKEEDRLLIERILVLLRNLLHIPPTRSDQLRTDDDASVHDRVLWAMLEAGFNDLLVFLTCSDEERQFAVHCLEIISLMFREQTADQLASAGRERHALEKEKDQRQLTEAMAADRARKMQRRMFYSTRHSRFGGTFVMRGVKSISDQDVVYHKPLAEAMAFTFDLEKQPRKKPKNRAPITEEEAVRRSTLAVRVSLRDFCVQFLENSYNPLMRAVKAVLQREQAQEHDETYYMWAVRFFMEFARVYRAGVEVVSETMSLPTFHFVQLNLANYYDMTKLDKQAAIAWSKRLHLALKAYRELLLTLCDMETSASSQLRESSKVLKNNIMYMMEYREILQLLLKRFDNTKQSRAFLRDLVETTHVYVKLMESWCKSNAHVVVQVKRSRKRRGAGRPMADEGEQDGGGAAGAAGGDASGGSGTAAADARQRLLDDRWDSMADELSAAVQGDVDLPSDDAVPFDAASDIDVELQRADCMRRIHAELRNGRPAAALALFRAARNVWPEKEEFGSADMDPEDEFAALRQVFYANLSSSIGDQPEAERVATSETGMGPRPGGDEETVTAARGEGEEPYGDDQVQDDDDAEAAEAEELDSVRTKERQFDMKHFLMGFANVHAMRSYTLVLSDYRNNSSHVNHCAVKMLHRLAVGCGLHGMLFQLSLFRVFQKIFADPATNADHFQELRQFVRYILRKFFESASSNPKMYIEILFWKTVRESVDIVEGYGSYKPTSKAKQLWTEEQDAELQRLFEQYKGAEQASADGSISEGKDWVDLVVENLIDQTRTRRQVVRQLVQLRLIGSAAEVKKVIRRKSSREWREEDEVELRQLFLEHRDSDDIVGDIVSKMSVPRSRRLVSQKIVALGLASDERELRKKGRRKSATAANDGSSASKSTGRGSRRRQKRPSLPESGDGLGEAGAGDGDAMAYEEAEELLESTDDDDDLSSDSDSESANQRDSSDDDSEALQQKQDRQSRGTAATADGKALLRAAVADGLLKPVQWLQTNLRQAAEERRSDESQAVPLVPVLEENELAMENGRFVDLLAAIGLQRPIVGQERYWRIPAELHADELCHIANGLDPESHFPLPCRGHSGSLSSRSQNQMATSSATADGRNSSRDTAAKRQRRAALAQLARKAAEAGGRPGAQKRKARAALREEAASDITDAAEIIDEAVNEHAYNSDGSDVNVPRGVKRVRATTSARRRLLDDSSDDDDDHGDGPRLMIDETPRDGSDSESDGGAVPLAGLRRHVTVASGAAAAAFTSFDPAELSPTAATSSAPRLQEAAFASSSSAAAAASGSPQSDSQSQEDKENRRPPTPPPPPAHLPQPRRSRVQLVLDSDSDDVDRDEGGSDSLGGRLQVSSPRHVAGRSAVSALSSDDEGFVTAVSQASRPRSAASARFADDVGTVATAAALSAVTAVDKEQSWEMDDGAAAAPAPASDRPIVNYGGSGVGRAASTTSDFEDADAGQPSSPSTRRPAKRRAVVISDDED